jgi:formylglycine-generating enzyme required for sulfatase activity
MVSVPAAQFMMGCNSMLDTMCKPDELPAHMVSISAFQIDKTEVTQSQYSACVTAGVCPAPTCDWDCTKGANLPAGCVHRADAITYCNWAKKRLPTEAEWELAARGTDGRVYPWGNDPATCDKVNMAGCGMVATDVNSHPNGASPYGALDMAGNVVELVQDYYGATYYAMSPVMDPPGPSSGEHYVGRGGGFKSPVLWLRTSSRDWYDTEDAGLSLGFRCAQ